MTNPKNGLWVCNTIKKNKAKRYMGSATIFLIASFIFLFVITGNITTKVELIWWVFIGVVGYCLSVHLAFETHRLFAPHKDKGIER